MFSKLNLKKWLPQTLQGRLLFYARALKKHQPQWGNLLPQYIPPASSPQKILFATSSGRWLLGSTVDATVATSIRLRGHEAHALLCDSLLPACMECTLDWFPKMDKFVSHGPQKTLCRDCTVHTRKAYLSLGLQVHDYSQFVTSAEVAQAKAQASQVSWEQARDFSCEGIEVGEHALAGALRFFARADLHTEPQGQAVFERYLTAGILTIHVARKLFQKHSFDCVVLHHAIYIPQGILATVARQMGIRIVSWNPSWRKQTFVFSHHETYHHALLTEPNANWENMEWDEAKEKTLSTYLHDRRLGTQDWIWFQRDPVFEKQAIEKETGVDFSLPCIGLLTNVLWDAQLHYRNVAFNNMLEWILHTLRYFEKRKDLQLLIRVHPAEITGKIKSRQTLMSEIEKVFPQLPPNIHIIRPESTLSTYAAMEHCDSVLIYGTKTGVELGAMGIPVIVCGEAWVRGKGFTTDVSSPAEYDSVLDALPCGTRLDSHLHQRAKKYAYHFIYRRMIPLEMFDQGTEGRQINFNMQDLASLQPAGSQGMDTICNGILHQKEFIHQPTQNPSLK